MAFGLESYQLRSFLFLTVMEYLLGKNGFRSVDHSPEEGIRTVRGIYKSVKGRSEWHDVDGVFDFIASIPFTDRLRLCVQAKFFDKKLSKMHIREFIGIMKDVEEVYMNQNMTHDCMAPRYRHQGVYFAMNGFTPEAQRLAWAHGIQTISFAHQTMMHELYKDMVAFARLIQEEKVFLDQGEVNATFSFLHEALLKEERLRREEAKMSLDMYQAYVLLHQHMRELQIAAIATIKQGIYLFVLSKNDLPFTPFLHTDVGTCQIHLEKQGRKRNYYFTINEGEQRFYFTRPSFVSDGCLLGSRSAMQQSLFALEQEQTNNYLQLCIRDQGIMRYFRLTIDPRLAIDS